MHIILFLGLSEVAERLHWVGAWAEDENERSGAVRILEDILKIKERRIDEVLSEVFDDEPRNGGHKLVWTQHSHNDQSFETLVEFGSLNW
jgi:hypothetical protein